jgi:hypothetical protein
LGPSQVEQDGIDLLQPSQHDVARPAKEAANVHCAVVNVDAKARLPSVHGFLFVTDPALTLLFLEKRGELA